jgi:hypothetical protein
LKESRSNNSSNKNKKRGKVKTLKKFIEEEIGFPLSLLIGKQKVVPLYGTKDKSFLFGSEIAKKEGAYLAQGDISSFIEKP